MREAYVMLGVLCLAQWTTACDSKKPEPGAGAASTGTSARSLVSMNAQMAPIGAY